MSNKRLSLEAFKAKAENVSTNEVLEKIQGGDWSDCHGCNGFWAKFKNYLKWQATVGTGDPHNHVIRP
jgi:hypothetical protein